jgi:hypothetical protein
VKLIDPISGKWTVRGFDNGAIFPENADPENVASLVRREYAEWLDADDAKAADKQEAEADKAEAAATKQRAADMEAAAKVDEEPAAESKEQPKKAAAKSSDGK